MVRFRRWLRHILEMITAFVLAPVVGEFFIDYAKKVGIYEHPSEWAGAIINWLVSLATDPTYRMIAAFITGLMLGTWVDTVLRAGWKWKHNPTPTVSPDRDEF